MTRKLLILICLLGLLPASMAQDEAKPNGGDPAFWTASVPMTSLIMVC